MANIPDRKRLNQAWTRLLKAGGEGVWDNDMVVIAFGKSNVKDDDLAVLADFPILQILDICETKLTDKCLPHIAKVTALEVLNAIDTKITPAGIKAFQAAHPNVKITTKMPTGLRNPFTGEPMDSKETKKAAKKPKAKKNGK